MTNMPYLISTLLYLFSPADEVLLIKRAKEPNRGLWSPCGGKLKMATGESPYECACREAREETGLVVSANQLHLTGIVSEHGYEGVSHWLMFLFEVKPRLNLLPAPISEGNFRFFTRAELDQLAIPQTDRESIWPWFWKHRGGFFAAHCRCLSEGRYNWSIEESRP
jgi:8-oxo-dGTP diphosphatase